MHELIVKHSNMGDVVLDTFAGAATTLLAAKNLGRGFVGCELDEEFFDKAEKRLFDLQVQIPQIDPLGLNIAACQVARVLVITGGISDL